MVTAPIGWTFNWSGPASFGAPGSSPGSAIRGWISAWLVLGVPESGSVRAILGDLTRRSAAAGPCGARFALAECDAMRVKLASQWPLARPLTWR
jgi:hypothetical protein